MKEVVLAPDLDSIFHLPLSLEAHEELLDLQTFVQEIDYTPDAKDSWTFLWGNQSYSSRRYYKLVFQNLHTSPIFAKIRKSKCTSRLKFFAWLIFVDRLNTKDMLRRRHFNVQPNSWCVLCDANIDEDIHHLFFTCSFATECWGRLGIQWSQSDNIADLVLHNLVTSGIPFFMEIFIIAAWEIWNLRNSKIFDQGSPTVHLWTRKFRDQVHLQLVRDQHLFVTQWLESIL